MAESMLRDDRIAATLNTRVLGLLGLPRQVEPSPDADKRTAKRAAKDLERRAAKLLPTDTMAQLLRWSIQLGVAVVEVLWYTNDEGDWDFYLKVWHPQFLYYRLDTRRYYLITFDGTIELTPGDGKWFVFAPDGLYRGWISGAVRSLATPWLGRGYAFRDWLRYCEVHGLPIKLIKHPSDVNEQEKVAALSSIGSMGSQGVMALPQQVDVNTPGWDFSLIEASDQAWEVFRGATEDCDKRIAITLLGQNLTTEVQGGSYAAATVHGQVRQDYLEADARRLALQLRDQVLRPWAAYNYGDPELAPCVVWETDPPEDQEQTATMLGKLGDAIVKLGQSAPEVDRRALLAQFDIPLLDPADTPDLPPLAAPTKGPKIQAPGGSTPGEQQEGDIATPPDASDDTPPTI